MREIVVPEKTHVKGLDARIQEAEWLFYLRAYGDDGKYSLIVVELHNGVDDGFRYGIFKIKGKSELMQMSSGCDSLEDAILQGCKSLSRFTGDSELWEGRE